MTRTSYIQWNDEDDDEVHFVLDQLDMQITVYKGQSHFAH
jgi:hypothetical protein